MRFREVEKIILADGWQYKNAKGSHCQYTPIKAGQGNNPEAPRRHCPADSQTDIQAGRAIKASTAQHKGGSHEINLSRMFLS